jgi:hypothetical protein
LDGAAWLKRTYGALMEIVVVLEFDTLPAVPPLLEVLPSMVTLPVVEVWWVLELTLILV